MTLETPLDERDNVHGFLAILLGILWISFAVGISTAVTSWLYPISALLIGAGQWFLANLVHEAASGTLFRSRLLNATIGRMMLGWPILQPFSDYSDASTCNNAGTIEDTDNPRQRYTIAGHVYRRCNQRVSRLLRSDNRKETLWMCLFHALVALIAYDLGGLNYLIIFWWVPFFFIYPIVSWFGQLITYFLRWTPF
ncbi:hypothetical protein N8E89_25430 (plasmid) [Phyllobacterium sp. A18/5-2]|uniref:fatty acid desaturase n=1 Tax=Phyllobacterium sp. A18/5-2 TaxID=2978392 RepID=UPI0021C67932|nr:fatty acid desaturase [Phyllobacterium sp. A18/5-2]UXN66459.1 hypothetical protein N8E89_25430 [Phyllobacterium sp. A18/5-2]